MTREELIEYIKANDHKNKYEELNFNRFSDGELETLKNIIDRENEEAKNQVG